MLSANGIDLPGPLLLFSGEPWDLGDEKKYFVMQAYFIQHFQLFTIGDANSLYILSLSYSRDASNHSGDKRRMGYFLGAQKP